MRRTNEIQLSVPELRLVAAALRERAPCRLLVFGLGNDSLFWQRVNRRGETIFIEDDEAWFERVSGRRETLRAHLVRYGVLRPQWRELLEAPDRLEMTLPEEIEKRAWDVILVDAPAGWDDSQPGRMLSIFLASRLAGDGGDVFVHDCDREIERAYSDRYLKPENLRAEAGVLRHYRIARRAGGPADTAS